MSIAGIYEAYKAWKQVKGSIKQITGSVQYKILELSNQVDRLVMEYKVTKVMSSDKMVASIKTRLKNLKAELTKLSTSSPKLPKIGAKMLHDLTREILESSYLAQMAHNELMRIFVHQYEGDLPEDDVDNWRATRLRLVAGRDAFRQGAITLDGNAFAANREINEAQRIQGDLRDVRDDPFMTPDQMKELERDYNEWLQVEIDVKDRQSRLRAMAKAFQKTAERLDFLIESGDLLRAKKEGKR